MSTGLECHIVQQGEDAWFYVLQDWDCPVGAWDWREYATAYGPFLTEEEASQHLFENHANPGGYSTYSVVGKASDPVLDRLFSEAIAPMRSIGGFRCL